MAERILTVELGLDANATRARTRFVERASPPAPPKPPEVGDAWCPLTVRARLQRVNWVLRRDPRVGHYGRDPEQMASCMPETVREMWKDQPGVPTRLQVPAADQDVITTTLTDLLRFKDDDEGKAVVYAIVEKTSGEELGKTLHCSPTHARTLMKRMLDRLAIDWNTRSWRPDARDIERAKKLIHRNIK